MTSELIIDANDSEVTIALLEDKKLVELNSEKKDQNFAVGDIYLGRVKKLLPGLNAAFVDIGFEKEGFLHYLDLGPQFQSLNKYVKNVIAGKQTDPTLNNFEKEPDINKGGKISQVMAPNQWVIVQIAKEPISTKGHRLASELSLAGRFVVITPFSDGVSVSSKIKNAEERNRLKRLALSIKPKNFSVIVRTVAEGKMVAELDKDIQDLMAKWKNCFELLKSVQPPVKVLGEMDRTSTILRDLLSADFNNVHVNDPALAEEIRAYVRGIAPEHSELVKLHKLKTPIFEQFGVDKQIKTVFGKTVNMQGGAYLVIEHTEAMHVIDVNSGIRTKVDNEGQESHNFQVNVAAAKEIARQLRLRDMGGIIVIDFIDMRNPENKKLLFESLRDEMKKDRARHTILPPSKFGLVQITRERVRQVTEINTNEKCPTCDGTGEVKSSTLIMDDIENNIRYFMQEQNEKKLTLRVHPYLEAFINRGFISTRHKWMIKYKRSIKVIADKSYHMMEYHFFNKGGEEIKI
ncbi:MAG: Rne/Rng family ribonuclease [Bacteroidia bacterium]